MPHTEPEASEEVEIERSQSNDNEEIDEPKREPRKILTPKRLGNFFLAAVILIIIIACAIYYYNVYQPQSRTRRRPIRRPRRQIEDYDY